MSLKYQRITIFVVGAILAQAIALGVGIGLVWLIPIRGTGLALIVLPIASIVVLGLSALAGAFALAWRRGKDEVY